MSSLLICGLLMLAAMGAWRGPAAQAAELDSREYAIKAAFLYKFADYIEWPESAFASPASPLTICVVGEDPFGSVLDAVAKGERAAGHTVAIKRIPVLDEASDCHVVYVRVQPAAALAAAAGKPVLTVSDAGPEPGTHGIINFVLKDNRVRFDIDVGLAASNRLTVSSKLLALAANVRGRERTP